MASSAAVSVGTSAVAIVAQSSATQNQPLHVTVQNKHATNKLYVGGVGVTTATGVEVAPGVALPLVITEQDAVYGIADGASTDVRVFRGRAG